MDSAHQETPMQQLPTQTRRRAAAAMRHAQDAGHTAAVEPCPCPRNILMNITHQKAVLLLRLLSASVLGGARSGNTQPSHTWRARPSRRICERPVGNRQRENAYPALLDRAIVRDDESVSMAGGRWRSACLGALHLTSAPARCFCNGRSQVAQ